MSDTVITITRGSDYSFQVGFKATAETPLVLTGAAVNLLDVPTALVGKITATITDEAGGIVTVSLAGATPIDVGYYIMRVQVIPTDGIARATPEIKLNIV